jgi:hypothetical protein
VNSPEHTTQTFNQYRVLLFSIAYRMLGSATDAEDIVQEAFLRWMDDRPYGVVLLDIEGEHIRRIYAAVNPDKLRWISL